MRAELRPYVGIASARIIDIVVVPTGYAVLTSAGVDLFDETLSKRETVASEAAGKLAVLPDGRFVVYSASLEVSVGGKPFEKIETGGFLRDLVVTPTGFIAIGSDQLLIDHDGARSIVEIEDERINGGGVAWKNGVAVAGRAGLTLFDAEGDEVARSEECYLTAKPVVVGSWIVCKGISEMHVFDAQAREVARTREASELRAFGGGLLASFDDSDGGPSTVSYWEFDDAGNPSTRWSFEAERPWQICVVGNIAVLGSQHAIELVDVDCNDLGKLERQGSLRNAFAFGDGIALVADQLLWWHEDEPLQTLEHDVGPGVVCSAANRIVSSEEDVLYVWRTDLQGPEPTKLETDLPFGVPLVVNGLLVTIESAAQFSLRARTLQGQLIGVRPKDWRKATTRDEAMRICERLAGRVFDGPLPAVDERLAQLPLAQTVDLFGKSWFASATLDAAVRERAAEARDTFFGELAFALGTSPRVLLAALRARKLKLEPPRPVAGYDYLGTFTSGKTLIVADPCYFNKATLPYGGFQLALKLNDAAEGLWHAFARGIKDSQGWDRNAELCVVHERGFDAYAGEDLGSIGVDGGCAGVFDKACPKRDPDQPLEEGIVSGLGAVVWSGYGDGGYPVFGGKHAGEIVKLRISFIDDAPEIDRLVAKSATAAKPYSAKATFVVGDAIAHPTFGAGSVTRVGSDGKIDVRFPDGMRTLIHNRK